MPPEIIYQQDPEPRRSVVREQDIEESFIEKLIAAQSDRRAALQTRKQGLMQQLFPSPAEAEA